MHSGPPGLSEWTRALTATPKQPLSSFVPTSQTGHGGATRAAAMLETPDKLIGLILLGNNLVNIIGHFSRNKGGGGFALRHKKQRGSRARALSWHVDFLYC